MIDTIMDYETEQVSFELLYKTNISAVIFFVDYYSTFEYNIKEIL